MSCQYNSYRYDFAPITREELDKSYDTLAYATVCRDGILTYYTGGGKAIKELRPASANRQVEFLEKLYNLPIVVEHPPVKLNGNPEHPLKVGNIVEVVGYDPQHSNVGTYIKIDDPDIKDKVLKGEYTDVSLGYASTILETPDGVYHDPIDDITYVGDFQRVQINIKPDHLAITKLGRAGSDVRIFPHLQKIKKDSLMLDEFDAKVYNIDDDHIQTIRFDSYLTGGIVLIPNTSKSDHHRHQYSQNGKTAMNKTFRRDSFEFSDVPESFCNWVHERLDAMDEIYRQLAEVQAENEQLQQKIAELQASEQQNAGRADALEEVCEKSVKYLAKQGYKWDSMRRDFVRTDGKSMQEEDLEEMDEGDYEDMEDEEDMEDMEEEEAYTMKRSKDKKMRQDAIANAIAQGLEVRQQAIALLDAYRIDSSTVDLSPELNPTQVQVNVISAINPNCTLYDNAAYIQARFDALCEQAVAAAEHGGYTEALQGRIRETRSDSTSQVGMQPRIKDSYKKPLRVTTRS